MLVAALDTSSNNFCFALQKNKKTLISKLWQQKNASSKILDNIGQALENHNYSFNDISKWLVGLGPGSFTGLRVGISFIQGLCFASNTQIAGINSSSLLLEAKSLSQTNIVFNDGRRDEVIISTFSSEKKATKKEYILKINQLPKLIQQKNTLVITAMSKEKFNLLDKPIIDKIQFTSITSCEIFFDSQIEKIAPTDGILTPIYVRQATYSKA